MNPIEFIRKNIVTQLVGEGFPEDVARGGQKRAWISIAACRKPAAKGAASTTASHRRASTAAFKPRKSPKEDRMENEVIVPFEMLCRDSHGVIVRVTGVDQLNHRVIFRRPGYEHDCACPRRDFGRKFKKVQDEH